MTMIMNKPSFSLHFKVEGQFKKVDVRR